MEQNYSILSNGYLESINKGMRTVRAFSGKMSAGKEPKEERLKRLKEDISKTKKEF